MFIGNVSVTKEYWKNSNLVENDETLSVSNKMESRSQW